VGSRAAKRWSKDAFDTLTEYVHPPRQARRVHFASVKYGVVDVHRARWLRPTTQALVYIEPLGAARHVPSSQHEQLLHLHQALVPEMVQHHLEYVSGLEVAWRKTVVEAGAAQAAGATALDAAAAGRAVLGVVQRIARQVGVRPTSVIEEGGRSNKGKDEV